MKGKKRALKGKTEEGDKNHVLKDALEEDGKEHALKDEVEEEDDDDDKKKVLKDETQGELPYATRIEAIRALSAHPMKRRAALIKVAAHRIHRHVLRHDARSNYGDSDNTDIPPCLPSYHTPMTNDLRNYDIQAMEAVCDDVQAVLNRTQWEVEMLTDQMMELEPKSKTKLEIEEKQEDLSAWL
ncbi:hypothetical protein PEX2_042080 [Penicillium expansum]|uniref:Uncharacterized protein n=1 Tax=Penicillium expansum TaxID=27334 RepID=A0A0A2K5T6_PENEN|nr:hypothetical protein PEX2_042080 [Penicillium expansum]KGO63194.1 hypothetical protein PEX2_042080 [Penicillium expansum]